MKSTLKLAYRNLVRNTRRTLLTAAAFSAGMAIIMVTNTLMKGTHESTIDRAVYRSSGHLQIQYKDYHENPILYNCLELDHIQSEKIKEVTGVKALLYRIDAPVLAESGKATRLVQIRGLDAKKEEGFGGLKHHLVQGSYLDPSDPKGVYIGEGVAQAIGVQKGDPVFFIGEARNMSIAAGEFRVRGIFRTGNMELDRNLILMNLSAASDLFAMEGYLTSASVMLESSSMQSSASRAIAKTLTEEERVIGWRKLIPELVQLVALDALFGEIMIGILGMIAIAGVVNTLITAILERKREFAILLAIGAPRKEIFSMVFSEAFLLSVFSVIPGLILGVAGSLYLVYNPIPLSGEAGQAIASWGFEPYMYGRLSAWNIVGTSLVFVVLGTIFSIWPALLAARTNLAGHMQATE